MENWKTHTHTHTRSIMLAYIQIIVPHLSEYYVFCCVYYVFVYLFVYITAYLCIHHSVNVLLFFNNFFIYLSVYLFLYLLHFFLFNQSFIGNVFHEKYCYIIGLYFHGTQFDHA